MQDVPRDASLSSSNDTSRAAAGDAGPQKPRVCAWCRGAIPLTKRAEKRTWCSKTCRQAAFRCRGRRLTMERHGRPMRFAYADPPFPGQAWKYYGREPSYAGEVNHGALIARLRSEFPDGWALGTSPDALRDLLPLCPHDYHLCPWVKPIGVPSSTKGLHTTWEALIVVGGRQEQPGVRDWLRAMPARRGGRFLGGSGSVAGAGGKPLAYCAFLFEALGMRLDDTLVDLFPGSGAVLRAWEEFQRQATSSATRLLGPDGPLFEGAPSPLEDDDASPESSELASPRALGDVSRVPGRDAFDPGRYLDVDPRAQGLRELCAACGHDRGDHLVGDGPCEGEGGCTCPMYESAPVYERIPAG
jgi:hypothetical protein